IRILRAARAARPAPRAVPHHRRRSISFGRWTSIAVLPLAHRAAPGIAGLTGAEVEHSGPKVQAGGWRCVPTRRRADRHRLKAGYWTFLRTDLRYDRFSNGKPGFQRHP